MFVEAIEKVSEFVRPIYIISRTLGSKEVEPSAATYFFVNNEGYAVMCHHTLDGIQHASESFDDYERYKKLVEQAPKHGKKRDEYIKSLNHEIYGKGNTIQMDLRFMDRFKKIHVIDAHPSIDLVLIKFEDIKGMNTISPIFKKNTSSIKEGKYLCQSGFAFPYYDNYKYNAITDRIEWTNTGNPISMPFNVNGMVARKNGHQLTMTTPGYDYMSGAPVFDTNGHICGMQHSVVHKYTNFNCDKIQVWHLGKKHEVTEFPFAHFAVCTDADSIKYLLKRNNVNYQEL